MGSGKARTGGGDTHFWQNLKNSDFHNTRDAITTEPTQKRHNDRLSALESLFCVPSLRVFFVTTLDDICSRQRLYEPTNSTQSSLSWFYVARLVVIVP